MGRKGGCLERGKKRPNPRGKRMQVQGAEESDARGKVETDTWGGGNRCFRRAETGGKGEKRGKVGWEAVDSLWGEGGFVR